MLPSIALTALTLAYPLLVYVAVGRFEPRWFAILLLVVAVLRALLARERLWWFAAAAAAMLALFVWLGNAWLPVKLYPVVVSFSLLALFALSLRYPPSVIERLARLAEPQLPAAAVAYTRRVTQAWCLFFLANGCVAWYTATQASLAWWALYNGLISYLLVGAMFAVEWLVRRRVRVRVAHG